MKPRLLLYLFVCQILCTNVGAQTFQIGHTTFTFTDSSRNDRTIEAEIYYPADVSGENVAVTSVPNSFPVLSFGHGFVMAVNAYENIWTNIVPKGYIIAFPKTEGTIAPSHLEFARDLAFVINAMTLESQNPTSLFYNRVGAMSAVMGHSMGGGAAFLAASLDSGIDAIAVLAPAETNPSAIAAAGTLNIQALVIAGTNDCVTPPSENQVPMYDALTSICKTYISIIGGSHCQMADSNFFCNFGEITCTPAPDITRDEQHDVVDSYLGNWLDATLKDNCVAGVAFDEQIISDSRISFEKNCLLCNPLAIADHENIRIEVYPNPFTDRILYNIDDGISTDFTLFDLSMRKIFATTAMPNTEINLPQLSFGTYYYIMARQGKIIISGKLIKN